MKLFEKFVKALPPAVALPLLIAPVALAGEVGGIETKEASMFVDKLKQLITDVGTPVGAVILVGSLIIVAIKFMTSGGNDRKRQEAIEGLTSVAIGGAILGGTLFLAGVILGIGQSLNS